MSHMCLNALDARIYCIPIKKYVGHHMQIVPPIVLVVRGGGIECSITQGVD